MPAAPPLHLVRHGQPLVDPAQPADQWVLDPAGFPAIDALRHAGRLPKHACWFSSPERKALDTARRLTDTLLRGAEVTVVPELAEQRRGVHWFEDGDAFAAAVRRAFADLDAPAVPAWEPLAQTRDRLVPAVRRVLEQHPTDELVLCGHGTAWTLLVAELTGATPDLEEWATLAMPDVWVVPRP